MGIQIVSTPLGMLRELNEINTYVYIGLEINTPPQNLPSKVVIIYKVKRGMYARR